MAAKETKEGGMARPETGMTDVEIHVSRRLQGDIPLDGRPFRRIAEETGLTEEEVLAIAGNLRERGIIRRFGAVVRHQSAGYTHNVMVLWAVAPEECAAAGGRLASFPEITHCYERTPPFAGRYNLFTMIHFQGKPDGERLRKMAEAAGTDDFRVLPSLEEFKKISMGYF
jgi:DNA-binding Lrp family transcriptional regulator